MFQLLPKKQARKRRNSLNSNLSKIKPKLRTEGAVSGNFGRAKVKAGSVLRDLGETKAEVVRLTSRQSYIEKMWNLYRNGVMQEFAVSELHRLGCLKEKRLESEQPQPYRPRGT